MRSGGKEDFEAMLGDSEAQAHMRAAAALAAFEPALYRVASVHGSPEQ